MTHLNTPQSADQIFFRCVEDCFEPIMLTDQSGRLTYVNPAWVLTYGYSKEEALGQTPRLLRSEYQDHEFYGKMWKTILDPKVGFWRGEVLNRAKDGHLVPVILTITPYREGSGEISGYMGIAVDLTEQKKMEQQILRQDRLASIGMLAGGLAHEIGNPLGVIRGRAELILNSVQENEFAVKNIEILLTQIDRISGLIKSLLRVGKIPEKVILTEISLEDSVNEVFSLMAETCRKANVELRKKNIDVFLAAESSHLEQILLNLLLNSLHAIEEQRLKSTSPHQTYFIEVSALQNDPDQVEILVRDNGCGISCENINKVFQPFYTTKAAGKGTGLGLSIVQKLAEEMKGSISLDSDGLGQGATFHLRLSR